MYNVFKRKSICDNISVINKLSSAVKRYGLKVIKVGIDAPYRSLGEYLASEEGKKNWKGYDTSIVYHLKDTKIEVTTSYGPDIGKVCTYIFDLNGKHIIQQTGLETFAQLCRKYKIVNAKKYNCKKLQRYFDKNTGKYVCSASPTLGYNPKYENQLLLNCYEYDLNSAYSNTILDVIPDLDNPIFDKNVGKGQVGFFIDDQLTMVKQQTKCEVDVVFNLIPAPQGLKEFIFRWYNAKKTAKTEEERLKAKSYLNLPIGYSQRYNPFLRAYVVHSCNQRIEDIVKRNKEVCVLWNTDAVYTLSPIEVDVGKEIGQFKVINFATLRYIGNTYQINDDYPMYRGIPKEWFRQFELRNGRKFDLLNDPVPKRANKYNWSWEHLKLTRGDTWQD